jgi:pterin-4a-carbinolamine dehydratase
MKITDIMEGQFRKNDIEDFVPDNRQLNNIKSKYLPDWEMLDHRTLQAKYVAKDHRDAMEFTRFVNELSEEMDHFAEVTQDVAEITIKTSTFDVKGLTILDFQLAMRVDDYARENDIEQVRMQGNFGMHENFADGKNPQDKGDSKRYGVPTKASVSTLRKVAKQGGRKGQLAHWMANMKSGKAKKK